MNSGMVQVQEGLKGGSMWGQELERFKIEAEMAEERKTSELKNL